MGYYDYTPLTSPYPMSWPAKDCTLCGAEEIAWAYPMREVTFPRQVDAAGKVHEVAHDSQPWFACTRCKGYVDSGRWAELATALGRSASFFDRLTLAKMDGSGYRSARSRFHR